MNDKEIIDLYIERDENAITITKEIYGKIILTLLYNILHDYHYSEDCENDCYYKLWKSIPPHTPYNYFPSFIRKIARNIALNFMKEKKHLQIEELTAELDNIMHSSDYINNLIDTQAISIILNSYISTLPKNKRDIFIRRYWYMNSIKEISQGYGIPIGTVKSILSRCRKELKDILIKYDYDM